MKSEKSRWFLALFMFLAKKSKKSAEKFAGIKKMRTFASAFEKNA